MFKILAACLLVMAFASSTAKAETLTDANLPKYDTQAECESYPAAHLPGQSVKAGQDFVKQCVTNGEQSRTELVGRNVDDLIVTYCDADTRLHGNIDYGPLPNGDFVQLESCIDREEALPHFRKIEEMMHTVETCDPDDPSQSQADYDSCEEGEKSAHDWLLESPQYINDPRSDACIAEMVRSGPATWERIENCTTMRLAQKSAAN